MNKEAKIKELEDKVKAAWDAYTACGAAWNASTAVLDEAIKELKEAKTDD